MRARAMVDRAYRDVDLANLTDPKTTDDWHALVYDTIEPALKSDGVLLVNMPDASTTALQVRTLMLKSARSIQGNSAKERIVRLAAGRAQGAMLGNKEALAALQNGSLTGEQSSLLRQLGGRTVLEFSTGQAEVLPPQLANWAPRVSISNGVASTIAPHSCGAAGMVLSCRARCATRSPVPAAVPSAQR